MAARYTIATLPFIGPRRQGLAWNTPFVGRPKTTLATTGWRLEVVGLLYIWDETWAKVAALPVQVVTQLTALLGPPVGKAGPPALARTIKLPRSRWTNLELGRVPTLLVTKKGPPVEVVIRSTIGKESTWLLLASERRA